MKSQEKLNVARLAVLQLRVMKYTEAFLKAVVDAQADGWELSEIGTSNDELRQIADAVLVGEAATALGTLRQINGNYGRQLGLLRGSLAKAGKSLDSIGTSEEELVRLGERYREQRADKAA